MATVSNRIQVENNAMAETPGTLQIVSFHLDKELYGIEITRVREINLITEITRVPQTPNCVKGLINLRNTVIPVIDLRGLFGLRESNLTDESRIMILQAHSNTVGIVVDAVREVLRVRQEQISPPPPTVVGAGQEHLTGIVKLENELLILLDIEKILNQGSVLGMESVAATW
jgi:purine-binding chemotaxis protein CheW